MLKEKQTDTIHWKERLQNLESLAGEEGLDKQAAWEGLHKRLYKKPTRKTAAWHWAAACTLLLLAVPFLLVKSGHDAATNNTVQKKQPAPATVFNQLNKKDNAVIILNKPEEKTAVQYLAEKKPAHSRYNGHLTTAGKRVVINSMIPAAASIEIKPPLGVIDSIRPVMALAAGRQKLKVVNINETGTESDPLFTAQFKKHKHFDIKFGGKNSPGTAMVSHQSYTDFHKIKIQLTN